MLTRLIDASLVCCASLALSLLAMPGARAEGSPDPRGLVGAVKGARAKAERALVNMVVLEQGKSPEKRRLQLKTLADAGDERMLIHVIEPTDVKGFGVLTLQAADGDDLQYFYMPSRRRVKPVTENDRTGLFAGTDLAFEDLRFEDLDKHAYRLVGEETVDGEACHLVEAKATDEDEAAGSGYSRRVLVIAKGRPVLVESRHYDRDTGALAKSIRFSDFRDVGGFARAHRVTVDHVKRNSKTVAVFADWVADPALDAKAFTTWALEHGS